MQTDNYVIKSPQASRFRSTALAHMDLRIAREMIEYCLPGRDKPPGGVEPYWTTALSRYGRAFAEGSGTPWGHQQMLSTLPEQLQETHTRMRFLRDKHVAHAVGIGEDFAVTAVVGPGYGCAYKVYGATVRKARIVSWGEDEASLFCSLLDALIPLVAQAEETAREELLHDLSTWPLESLTKWGVYEKSAHSDTSSPLFRDHFRRYKKE